MEDKTNEKKSFASTNVVFGIDSYTYQYNTRDTFGFALKSTYAEIEGVEHQLFKDPKTDIGSIKKAHKGLVAVIEQDGKITYIDGLTKETYKKYAEKDLLEDVFLDGKLLRDQSLPEIHELLIAQ